MFIGRLRNGWEPTGWVGTECVVVFIVMFMGRQWNAWEPTGWVGTECVVVFIGRAWTEQAMETRPGVP